MPYDHSNIRAAAAITLPANDAPKLEWAVFWAAEYGILVSPAHSTDDEGDCSCGKPAGKRHAVGKHPLTEHGHLDATLDPTQIRQWWERWPFANIIGAVGEAGLTALDLDRKDGKDGVCELGSLEIEHGAVPSTLAFETPSGGQHLLVRGKMQSKNRFRMGFDVKSDGGYILLPGSTRNGKPYRVLHNRPVADCPSWLSAMVGAPRVRSAKADEEPSCGWNPPDAFEQFMAMLRNRAIATEGDGGDDHTYAAGCFARDWALSLDMALEALTTPYRINGEEEEFSWNERCNPIWDWDDLGTVVGNAYRYAKYEPGCRYVNPSAMDEATDRAFADDAEAITPPAKDKPAAEAFRMFTGAAILSTIKRRETIIAGVLLEIGNHHFVAARGSGKTATLLDMGLAIASDSEWQGLPVKPGFHVVYGALEDAAGAVENIRAWCKEHNRTVPERFHLIDEPFNLMRAEDVDRWSREIQRRLNGARAVVMLDTWGRAISRAEHGTNNDAEMRTANANCEALARDLRGPSVSAAHPPKDIERVDTVRGSGVQEDDSAAIWVLRSNKEDRNAKPVKLVNLNDERRFVVERLKGSPAKPIVFQLKKVDLGETDEQGQPRSGIVVTRRGLMSRLPSGDPITIKDDPHAVAQAVADAVQSEPRQPVLLQKLVERLMNTTAHGFEFPGRTRTAEAIKHVLKKPVKLEAGTVWITRRAANNALEVYYANVNPDTIQGPFPGDEIEEPEIEFPPVS
jgi:hypothetical protein